MTGNRQQGKASTVYIQVYTYMQRSRVKHHLRNKNKTLNVLFRVTNNQKNYGI